MMMTIYYNRMTVNLFQIQNSNDNVEDIIKRNIIASRDIPLENRYEEEDEENKKFTIYLNGS
jgi:hypothetical protein